MIKKKTKTVSDANKCPCGKTLKKKPAWIACDKCSQWWHGNCVNLTKEICGIFREKNLPFVCPVCIVSNFSLANRIDKNSDNNSASESVTCKSSSSCSKDICDKEIKDSSDSNILSSSTQSAKNFVIIDGLKDPKKFQDSRVIQKEIRKHKGDIQVKYAFPLNRGGIAVQVESEKEKESLKEQWPEGAFMSGGSLSVHERSYTPKCVLKNIATFHSTDKIEQEVEKQTGVRVSARRLKYRDTGRPMPIVVVTCDNSKDIQCLFKADISVHQRRVKVEPYNSKRFTPTRCFNCQEFGHIAVLCKNNKKCENCAEDHQGSCVSSSHCVNCGNSHRASSADCPVYIAIKERLLSRRQ